MLLPPLCLLASIVNCLLILGYSATIFGKCLKDRFTDNKLPRMFGYFSPQKATYQLHPANKIGYFLAPIFFPNLSGSFIVLNRFSKWLLLCFLSLIDNISCFLKKLLFVCWLLLIIKLPYEYPTRQGLAREHFFIFVFFVFYFEKCNSVKDCNRCMAKEHSNWWKLVSVTGGILLYRMDIYLFVITEFIQGITNCWTASGKLGLSYIRWRYILIERFPFMSCCALVSNDCNPSRKYWITFRFIIVQMEREYVRHCYLKPTAHLYSKSSLSQSDISLQR